VKVERIRVTESVKIEEIGNKNKNRGNEENKMKFCKREGETEKMGRII
jgi:hypothetical protein